MRKKEIRLTTEVREKLEEFVTRCEYYKNSYFWTPPLSANQRRYREEKDSIELFEFKVNDDEYSIEFNVSMSCKNVYAKSHIYKNEVKTTLTVIKTLLKKDKGLAEVPEEIENTLFENNKAV